MSMKTCFSDCVFPPFSLRVSCVFLFFLCSFFFFKTSGGTMYGKCFQLFFFYFFSERLKGKAVNSTDKERERE